MSTEATAVPAEVGAEVSTVEQAVAQARAQANALEVRDEASAETAAQLLRDIQKRRKAAESKRREYVDPLNATVRQINADFKAAMAPYEEADKIVRGKLGDWQAEQDRIRREEQARLERERQERERIAREAREREEREARERADAKAREAREAAELAAAEADEEMQAMADEAAIEAQEASAAADAIAALPDVPLPMPVVPVPAKQAGVSTRKRWVVKSIDASRLPAEYLAPDEKAINAAMREGVKANGRPPEIPGVEFEQRSELAVRS